MLPVWKALFCFCPQTRYSPSSDKQGSCLIHVLSVFNDRISWYEYVLQAVIIPMELICLGKGEFRNWQRLKDCCHFALWTPGPPQQILILKTTIKAKLPSLLVLRNKKNFRLKEQCHDGFAVLGQFCAEMITLRLWS